MLSDIDDTPEFLKYINFTVSGISLFAGLFVISVYFFFKEIRLFIYETIMLLCIGRVIMDISSFFPINDKEGDEPSYLCKVQGAIMYGFQKYTWIMCTYLIYFTYIYGLNKKYMNKHAKVIRLIFLSFALVFSFSFGGLVYYMNVISFNGLVCGLSNKNMLYQKINFRIILISIMIDIFFILLNIYLLIKTVRSMKALIECNPEFKKIFTVIKYFPIFKFVGWLPNLILLVYTIYDGNGDRNVVLSLTVTITIFSSIFTSICGVIYLWLPHVRISMKAFLKRMCGGKNELDLLEENDFFDIMEARKSEVKPPRDD